MAVPSIVDYALPPSAIQVEVALRGQRYWPSEEIEQDSARQQCAVSAAGALREFEQRTGWRPFVPAPGAIATTRHYRGVDVDGILQLNAGLISLSGVTVGGSSLTIDGANPSVYLGPANAADEGDAYTELEFYGAYSGTYGSFYGNGRPNHIAVTGVWGRYSVWPADAWREVLRKAVFDTLTMTNQDQDLGSISEAGFSASYDLVGPIDPKTIVQIWPKSFDAACERYRRPVVF